MSELLAAVRCAQALRPVAASALSPFVVVGATAQPALVGWVHAESAFVSALTRASPLFELQQDGGTGLATTLVCSFPGSIATKEERSAAVAPALKALRQDGLVPGWRDELYPCSPLGSVADLHTLALVLLPAPEGALFDLERAAATRLGIAQFGVHANVFSRAPDGTPSVWVARRSPTKQTWPDHYDQCVAGGLAAGEDVALCAERECAEEASIDVHRDAVVPLRAVSFVSHARLDDSRATAHGLPGVWLEYNYIYDVEVDASYVPAAADGEVASFERVAVDELRHRLAVVAGDCDAQGTEFPLFTPAALLANVDFLCRHGCISPTSEGAGAYAELQSLLRFR